MKQRINQQLQVQTAPLSYNSFNMAQPLQHSTLHGAEKLNGQPTNMFLTR